MITTRDCGCKGIRSCLICEEKYSINKSNIPIDRKNVLTYCPVCRKAYPELDDKHPNHEGKPMSYPGVYIELDFINEDEEEYLLKNIDNEPWDPSQSGRRKQNYGPKCNFKKKKLKPGDFNGFPLFSKFIQERFKKVEILKDFFTIEQCSLEYDPDKGASIDPHVDDCWIWGERIVTVNLLSDSILTMTYNTERTDRYNIDCVSMYPQVVDKNNKPFSLYSDKDNFVDYVVRLPMPRRSLMVLYGSPRYNWEHQVLRSDIATRRVCIAYREFTPTYLRHGEKYLLGEPILKRAQNFFETT